MIYKYKKSILLRTKPFDIQKYRSLFGAEVNMFCLDSLKNPLSRIFEKVNFIHTENELPLVLFMNKHNYKEGKKVMDAYKGRAVAITSNEAFAKTIGLYPTIKEE